VTLPIDVRDHGFSPATYGALIALNGVLIFLLQPLVARALAPYPGTAFLPQRPRWSAPDSG